MASIVQQSDFTTGLFQITQNDEITAKLNESITRIEKKILTDLLGIDLKDDYDTGIAVLPTPDVKWTELRDGKKYTDTIYNTKVEYEGFKALLIPFTYADYVVRYTINTPIGIVEQTGINGEKINKTELAINANSAYNVGFNQYQKAKRFIRQFKTDTVYDNWLFTPKSSKWQ